MNLRPFPRRCPLLFCGNGSRGQCGGVVESLEPAIEIVGEQLREAVVQLAPAPPRRHKF